MSYPVAVVREGLPKPLVRLAMLGFLLALVGLLSWFAYFASSRPPSAVLDRVGVLPSLFLTAGLSGGVTVMAGTLAFHYKRESYGSGEETLFRSCMIVSTGILVFSVVWALGILVFG